MREDLFLVSAEHFISDTASYADIVLPASMGAEMEDMILSWGHLHLTYNTKCADLPARPSTEQRDLQAPCCALGLGRGELQVVRSRMLAALCRLELAGMRGHRSGLSQRARLRAAQCRNQG